MAEVQQKLYLQQNLQNSFTFAQPIDVFSPAQQKIRKLNLHLVVDGASASTLFSKMLLMLFALLIFTLTGFAIFYFLFSKGKDISRDYAFTLCHERIHAPTCCAQQYASWIK